MKTTFFCHQIYGMWFPELWENETDKIQTIFSALLKTMGTDLDAEKFMDVLGLVAKQDVVAMCGFNPFFKDDSGKGFDFIEEVRRHCCVNKQDGQETRYYFYRGNNRFVIMRDNTPGRYAIGVLLQDNLEYGKLLYELGFDGDTEFSIWERVSHDWLVASQDEITVRVCISPEKLFWGILTHPEAIEKAMEEAVSQEAK